MLYNSIIKVLSKELEKLGLADRIMAYESGELSDKETLELFSELIKTGEVWHMQGSYGRMADFLIKNSIIDKNGVIQ